MALVATVVPWITSATAAGARPAAQSSAPAPSMMASA